MTMRFVIISLLMNKIDTPINAKQGLYCFMNKRDICIWISFPFFRIAKIMHVQRNVSMQKISIRFEINGNNKKTNKRFFFVKIFVILFSDNSVDEIIQNDSNNKCLE